MCGIAGIARPEPTGISAAVLTVMREALRHRGPDAAGIYQSPRVGLAHVRLSIVDLEGGVQPFATPDGRFVIIYNGEVYNHPELRRQLEQQRHRFSTRSDTEVVLRAYMEWGAAALQRMHGQFAFAIYDQQDQSVFLGRDRFGVRPLFYSLHSGTLIFASEVKAIFASGEVVAEADPQGLDQVFTFWAARAPRTVFRNVLALEPGCWARWQDGALKLQRWWAPEYQEAATEPKDIVEQLDELLHRSVSERMRADVPVGAYVSGGLDSAVTATLARQASPHQLRTFSISFDDATLDESPHQREVVDALGSLHKDGPVTAAAIAKVFPSVVRFAETPMLRTAPAPMFLLSRLTREANIKVVLTGEGADELFLGYDLFRESAVRRFSLRSPGSKRRARLFDRLYPYQTNHARGNFWQQFFLASDDVSDPLFSHLPRFLLASRIKDFYSAEFRERVNGFDPIDELRGSLPSNFNKWSHANQAAYLELTTLLEPYLLSTQGDRMALAHGVEGRYPFLDHRLFEWSARLPVKSKLRALSDKRILRRWAAGRLPAGVARRPKQPYRAPDAAAFFGQNHPAYVEELLGEDSVRNAGYFDPAAVQGLVRRCRAGRVISVRENQALVAVLSTQLWHQQFVAQGKKPGPITANV